MGLHDRLEFPTIHRLVDGSGLCTNEELTVHSINGSDLRPSEVAHGVLEFGHSTLCRPDLNSISSSCEQPPTVSVSDSSHEGLVSRNLLGSSSVGPVVKASVLTTSIGIALLIPAVYTVRQVTRSCSFFLLSVFVPKVDVADTSGAEPVISLSETERDVVGDVGVSFLRPVSHGPTSSHSEHVHVVVSRLINCHYVLVVSRDGDAIHSHRATRKLKTLYYLTIHSIPSENGRRRSILPSDGNLPI